MVALCQPLSDGPPANLRTPAPAKAAWLPGAQSAGRMSDMAALGRRHGGEQDEIEKAFLRTSVTAMNSKLLTPGMKLTRVGIWCVVTCEGTKEIVRNVATLTLLVHTIPLDYAALLTDLKETPGSTLLSLSTCCRHHHQGPLPRFICKSSRIQATS